MRHAGLVAFRRHDPDLVRQFARDFFAGLKSRRVDAVVVGDEDTHVTRHSGAPRSGEPGIQSQNIRVLCGPWIPGSRALPAPRNDRKKDARDSLSLSLIHISEPTR